MKEHTKLRIGRAGLLAGLAILLTACVGGVGSSPVTQTTPGVEVSLAPSGPSYAVSPSDAPSTSPGLPGQTAAPAGSPVTESDNGRSVVVRVGSDVTLVLHSNYWQISKSSDPAVLALVTGPDYSGAGSISCVPGTGCGTVTTVFHALTPGQATVTASRTSCGEVMACTGTAGAYKVTFVVEG
jgi:hypothetical protein